MSILWKNAYRIEDYTDSWLFIFYFSRKNALSERRYARIFFFAFSPLFKYNGLSHEKNAIGTKICLRSIQNFFFALYTFQSNLIPIIIFYLVACHLKNLFDPHGFGKFAKISHCRISIPINTTHSNVKPVRICFYDVIERPVRKLINAKNIQFRQ